MKLFNFEFESSISKISYFDASNLNELNLDESDVLLLLSFGILPVLKMSEITNAFFVDTPWLINVSIDIKRLFGTFPKGSLLEKIMSYNDVAGSM